MSIWRPWDSSSGSAPSCDTTSSTRKAKKKKRKDLTFSEIEAAVHMRNSGCSAKEVAEALGMSLSNVYRIDKRSLQHVGSGVRLPYRPSSKSPVLPSIIRLRRQQMIKEIVQRNPDITLDAIRELLPHELSAGNTMIWYDLRAIGLKRESRRDALSREWREPTEGESSSNQPLADRR